MKIGVVGVGSFSDDFIWLFNIHPDVAEVVLCDLYEDRIEASKEKHGITRSYASFDEILEKADDLDCIGIFTQRHLHGPMIIKALKAGKHVFSAVPIGCNLEEIEEIVRLCEEKRLIYMMGETCYYFPCSIFCRERYQEGGFGKFVYGESQYYHDMCEMYLPYERTGGKDWKRTAAGIPPMYYPTHSISMIFSAIDEYATKVSCMGYRDNHEDNIFGEDKNDWHNPFSNETAIFQMSGGGVIRINEFRRIGINKPSSYITCFYGDIGSYEYSVTQHSFQRGRVGGVKPYLEDVSPRLNTYKYNEDLTNGTLDKEYEIITSIYANGFAPIHNIERLPKSFRCYPNRDHYNSHPFLVDDFVRAVMTGKLPPCNAWDSARWMIPGLIAHESALRGGELMDVPDFGGAPSDWEKITYDMPDSYENMDRYYLIERIDGSKVAKR